MNITFENKTVKSRKLLLGVHFGRQATGDMLALSTSGTHVKHRVLSKMGAVCMESTASYVKRALELWAFRPTDAGEADIYI